MSMVVSADVEEYMLFHTIISEFGSIFLQFLGYQSSFRH